MNINEYTLEINCDLIDELIIKQMPDCPPNGVLQIRQQLIPLMELFNKEDFLRRITLVELLRDYYVIPILKKLNNQLEPELVN